MQVPRTSLTARTRKPPEKPAQSRFGKRPFASLTNLIRLPLSVSYTFRQVTGSAPDVNQLVLNVGSGQETSMRQLAQLILDVTGSSAEILYAPRNETGVSRLCADTELAAKMLGFKPRTGLMDGLKLTLKEDERFERVKA